MYLILNIINQLSNAIIYCLLASFLLTPKYSRIKSISSFVLISLFVVLYKFSFYSNLTVRLITAVISQSLLYIFIIISFKESLFKKILACILIFTTAIIAEYTTLLINNSIFNANNAFYPASKEFYIVTTVALFSQIIISVLVIFIWKTITHKKSYSNMIYFSLLPHILLYLIATIFAPFVFGGTALNSAILSICITTALIVCIILFYYTLRRNEKKTIEEAYEELQTLYAMDLEYYRELESKHEELSKIRHDYQNQLATLYMLISSGKTDTAKEFADSLKKSMQS